MIEIRFGGDLYFGIQATLVYESLYIIKEVYRKGCTCDRCYTNCYVFRTEKYFVSKKQVFSPLSGFKN